jgi:hypothetical protein
MGLAVAFLSCSLSGSVDSRSVVLHFSNLAFT